MYTVQVGLIEGTNLIVWRFTIANDVLNHFCTAPHYCKYNRSILLLDEGKKQFMYK